MMRSLTLGAALTLTASMVAQDVQRCCSASSSTFMLGSTTYARHTQCLYTPGDLTGEANGHITRLYFRYGTGVNQGNTLGAFRISLGQTTATTFSDATFLTDLDTVLEASSYTIAAGATGNWFSIDLTTPFPYDASKSLVVDTRFETSQVTNFGTQASDVVGQKIISPSTTDPTGQLWETLQDIGFDVIGSLGMSTRVMTQVNIFPNPTSTQVDLTWSAPLEENASLTVCDLSGRMVLEDRLAKGSVRTSVGVSDLAEGIYTLQVRDGSGLLLSKRLMRE